MKIYTTYYANVKNLPSNIIPISIAGKAIEWWRGLEYKKLAPKYSFFKVWKKNNDNDYYIEHFSEEVLSKLSIIDVVNDLENMSNGSDIALVCYETPDKFCHRHLVANWMNFFGCNVKEY